MRHPALTAALAYLLSICPYHESCMSSRDVEIIRDIPYARASGHWSANMARDNDVLAQIRMFRHTRAERELELTMDIYRPADGERHPLVMLIHGGAYYANSKDSPPVSNLCRDIAGQGYVCASINYRMGYRLNRSSVQKARMNALEDASDAMNFLLGHSVDYAIDTSSVFIGGASSGAITALMLADGVPNLKGIINMWGGVDSLDCLDGCQAPILSIHGDRDKTVPYEEGYPLGGRLMGYLYGSKAIMDRCRTIGREAELLTLEGYRHAPYRNRDFSLNQNYEIIRDRIIDFLKSH